MAAEDAQFEEFESALAEAAGRPGLLFTHKPVFYVDPDDPRTLNHAVLCLEGRRRVLDLCRDNNVRVIASGHLHFYRTARLADIDLILGPGDRLHQFQDQEAAACGGRKMHRISALSLRGQRDQPYRGPGAGLHHP